MALIDNLVSYWKMDETGTGNAEDSHGSNTFTNVGPFTYATGKINNGADFGVNNTTKELTRADDMGIDGGALTMNIWVKLQTEIDSGAGTFNLTKIQSSTEKIIQYIDYEYNGGTRILHWRRFKFVHTVNDFTHTVTLGTSNWNMITYTYDGTTVKGYLNGTSVGSVASSGYGATAISAGSWVGDVNKTSAIFDEYGVWSRALIQDEVTELYNSGSGLAYPFSEDEAVSGLQFQTDGLNYVVQPI